MAVFVPTTDRSQEPREYEFIAALTAPMWREEFNMRIPKVTKTTIVFILSAISLFFLRTAIWAILFRPWSDSLGFGLVFTLATIPLSATVSLFAALWVARRTYRSTKNHSPQTSI